MRRRGFELVISFELKVGGLAQKAGGLAARVFGVGRQLGG